MERNDWDYSLNQATHAVASLWADYADQELLTNELYALNDCLSAHFCGKRRLPRGDNDENL